MHNFALTPNIPWYHGANDGSRTFAPSIRKILAKVPTKYMDCFCLAVRILMFLSFFAGSVTSSYFTIIVVTKLNQNIVTRLDTSQEPLSVPLSDIYPATASAYSRIDDLDLVRIE